MLPWLLYDPALQQKPGDCFSLMNSTQRRVQAYKWALLLCYETSYCHGNCWLVLLFLRFEIFIFILKRLQDDLHLPIQPPTGGFGATLRPR